MSSEEWILYILRCTDDTLYTGVTNNLAERLVKHGNGTGAKYTRGRGPYEVVFSETHTTRGAAQKREAEIKTMDKQAKIGLIKNFRS